MMESGTVFALTVVKFSCKRARGIHSIAFAIYNISKRAQTVVCSALGDVPSSCAPAQMLVLKQ
jgi:hypothetical protein